MRCLSFYLGLLVASSVIDASPTIGAQKRQSPKSIDAAMKAKGKYWGTTIDSSGLSNPQNAAIVQKSFGQVTPDNSMQW